MFTILRNSLYQGSLYRGLSVLLFIFLLYIEEKIDRPEATGSPKQSKFSPMVIASLGAMAIGGMALISSAGPALQVMCL